MASFCPYTLIFILSGMESFSANMIRKLKLPATVADWDDCCLRCHELFPDDDRYYFSIWVARAFRDFAVRADLSLELC